MNEERRTPACHYDRAIGERVTKHHDTDCPTLDLDHPAACPGHDGCEPCTESHCITCGREHLDPAHPLTCDTCIGTARDDLNDIVWLSRHLRWQATRGNGLANASAPIPGGDALVVYARAGADLEDLIWSAHLNDDHGSHDPVPVLLPLAPWDTRWRQHLGHKIPTRPTLSGITGYLMQHLTRMAQAGADGTPAPDWQAFTTDIAALRRQLEGIMHDEKEPERGVGCFECGRPLVRRWGTPRPCNHRTPGKVALAQAEKAAARAVAHLIAVASYPELGEPYLREQSATRVPDAVRQAAKQPCEACSTSRTGQGGLLDPSVGQAWECLGCRKQYTPGEYANAVRHDLLTSGPGRDGWTHISMAADAATTQTGIPVLAATVRKWSERTQVSSLCQWQPGARFGIRLVFWPDVADRAAEAVERHWERERERARYAAQKEALKDAIEAGRDPYDEGKRRGFHPARVAKIVHELEQAAAGRGKVTA